MSGSCGKKLVAKSVNVHPRLPSYYSIEHQREETLFAQGHTHVKKGLDVVLDIISLCDMSFIYLL